METKTPFKTRQAFAAVALLTAVGAGVSLYENGRDAAPSVPVNNTTRLSADARAEAAQAEAAQAKAAQNVVLSFSEFADRAANGTLAKTNIARDYADAKSLNTRPYAVSKKKFGDDIFTPSIPELVPEIPGDDATTFTQTETTTSEIFETATGGGFYPGVIGGGYVPCCGGGVIVNPPTPAPGVPEPATWMTMIVGFGMIGAAMRRQRGTPSFDAK